MSTTLAGMPAAYCVQCSGKGQPCIQAETQLPVCPCSHSEACCLVQIVYAAIEMSLNACQIVLVRNALVEGTDIFLNDCQVGPHDQLIMMRPTGLPANSYQPLQTPLQGDAGESWDPSKYERRKDVPTGARRT